MKKLFYSLERAPSWINSKPCNKIKNESYDDDAEPKIETIKTSLFYTLLVKVDKCSYPTNNNGDNN